MWNMWVYKVKITQISPSAPNPVMLHEKLKELLKIKKPCFRVSKDSSLIITSDVQQKEF